MAMSLCALRLGFSSVSPVAAATLSSRSRKSHLVAAAQSRNGRQVWRRRKLTKEDDMLRVKLGRVPFLEEQVRKIRENGKLLSFDIEWLMKNEDNKYEFVNEVAAEATEYVERNRDDYGGNKKAILHVLTNRMNDAGFYRPEAYEVSDPFRPGPDYLKEEFY